MGKIVLVIIMLITLTCVPVESYALFKSTKFTVVVLNEEGKSLSGVKVGVGFEKNNGWGTDSAGQQGISGADGRMTFSGQSNGHITYGGSKDGYYPSFYDYDFQELGTFGWEPWNPELKIVMRKIENPVSMYARDTKFSNLIIPEEGKKIGFDLIEFDWLPPYGKGKNADFLFFLERRFAGMKDYDSILIITFSSENDGILKIVESLEEGSLFKLPRTAPKDGYVDKLVLKRSKHPKVVTTKNYTDNDNYIFRIRSRKDENGEISAIYGKIYGPIVLEPRTDPADLNFKYYLNPSGTRNLEFDPNKNLFTDLTDLEQVGIK